MNKYKTEQFKQEIINVCKEGNSMRHAWSLMDTRINFKTFVKYAKSFGCYETNQSGKGLTKRPSRPLIPLDEILEGKQPQYSTNKLRLRLIKEGIRQHQCDGNSSNHKLDNLKLLCPNCHALTPTYRGRNIKSK